MAKNLPALFFTVLFSIAISFAQVSVPKLSPFTSASEFNNKPRVFVDFDSRLAGDSILISVQGTDGTVNFWNTFV